MNKIYALLWGFLLLGISSLVILFSTVVSIKRINNLAFSDKLYHAGAYGLLAFIIAGLLCTLSSHYSKNIIIEAVTIAILIGIIMEFSQFFFPGRTPDVADLCANIIGACIGATFFAIAYYVLYR